MISDQEGVLHRRAGDLEGLRDEGLQFVRAKVGDRYVRELMETQGWHLGGESSGHIICSDVTTTGDGIVSSLQVLLALRHSNQSLSEMLSAVPLFPQTMINVRLAAGTTFASNDTIDQAVANAEQELGDSGRVLLRPSGIGTTSTRSSAVRWTTGT